MAKLMEIINVIAIITNTAIVIFTSKQLDFIYNFDALQKVWVFVLVEHFLLIAKFALKWIIDDVPEWVNSEIAKQEYLHDQMQETLIPIEPNKYPEDNAVWSDSYDSEDDNKKESA